MTPKTEGTARKAKVTMASDAFLAACIKHAKEKLIVDFDALAKDIGMSVGGAA